MQSLAAGTEARIGSVTGPGPNNEEESQGQQVDPGQDFRWQAESQKGFRVTAPARVAPVVVEEEPQTNQAEYDQAKVAFLHASPRRGTPTAGTEAVAYHFPALTDSAGFPQALQTMRADHPVQLDLFSATRAIDGNPFFSHWLIELILNLQQQECQDDEK